MSQFDYIKDITRFGLENNREGLLNSVNDLIEYSKNTRKINFALQLQSILKDSQRTLDVTKAPKLGTQGYFHQINERETDELVLEKLTSDYSLKNLISSDEINEKLFFFLKEHHSTELLRNYNLPISNKIILHGPSGCGKTLASYVIAGELKKLMIVVNLGAIVSAKLGETSKNLAKIFRKAASEDCIIFIDEFDSIGKIRDYGQDHGEMKRVVNTILQLFDYLPQSSMVIAATNQKDAIDDALLRRFDVSLEFELPTENQIKKLIDLTISGDRFHFDKPSLLKNLIKNAIGLSYYSIQKTLVNAIKRSLFNQSETTKQLKPKIDTSIWMHLLQQEKTSLKQQNY
jgi:SpoVK/Ycf46/Vps4 family AAA+-type ATPase